MSASASLDPSIPRSLDPSRRNRAAFSLLEMMIAIVILGIGLIMVATMFPVAWTRARTLSETTVERSIAAGAQATLAQSLKPATLKTDPTGLTQLTSASLLGDLLFFGDPANPIIRLSDTRVHALNMSNLPAGDLTEEFIDEEPWLLEKIQPGFGDPDAVDYFDAMGSQSFFASQVPFTSRVHPPLPPRPAESDPSYSSWFEQLDQRRFAISILHRLQSPVGPDGSETPAQQLEKARGAIVRPRVFDMYYVTLRKPNPTNRYARQDPETAPDNSPTTLDSPAPKPGPLPASDPNADVVFPVPWRVEVDFYVAPTVFKTVTATSTGPTGVPTEIRVPRQGSNSAIAPQLFPLGTRLIDEVSGNVYRVANRRISFEGNDQIAYLTLDREVFIDDLDFMNPSDPSPDGNVQREEQVRTVWVFPPAVDRSDPQNPNFDGPSPVVSIEVRTMTLSPSN